MEVDEATVEGLAAKLTALELTDKERAILDHVLERAERSDAETVGFVWSEDELIAVVDFDRAGLSGIGLKLAGASGLLSANATRSGMGGETGRISGYTEDVVQQD